MGGVDLAEFHRYILSKLRRVIMWGNEKGGVGKTTAAANTAGTLAALGFRVLIIDLNRQGNVSTDLGCEDGPIDDGGAALAKAIMFGDPLAPQPVPGRDGLFLCPGGSKISALTSHMIELSRSSRVDAYTALAKALAPISGDYDFIMVDTPPENPVLVDLAMGASMWLVIPIKSDSSSINGMKKVADQFLTAREVNPNLQLMGSVLFGTNRGATKIHRDVRSTVSEAFGGHSPMFESIIGHSEALAKDCRDRGLLAFELESLAAKQPAWWEQLKAQREGGSGSGTPPRIARTASSVSADYANLCAEMVEIVNTYEEQAGENT